MSRTVLWGAGGAVPLVYPTKRGVLSGKNEERIMSKKIGFFVLFVSALIVVGCDDDEAVSPDAGTMKFDQSNWDQSNWG